MSRKAKELLFASSAAALVTLGWHPAVAQTAPNTVSTPPVVAAPAASVEEVVVTGSRIARKDYVSESPILTASTEVLQKSGTVNLEQSLNQLPQFTGSSGAQGPNLASNAARAGRANLNLRGLGIARTLILLDGRRLTPGDIGGAVDVNVIPSSILGAAEVITGGASATYGSDAIAGVVNLKVKDLNGVRLDVQGGVSSRGDGPFKQLSVAAGGNFAEDRGKAIMAFEYYNRELINRDPETRDYFDNEVNPGPVGGLTTDSANLPSQAAVNALFGGYGATLPKRTANFYARLDGSLFSFDLPPSNLKPGDSFGPFKIIPQIDAFGNITRYRPNVGALSTLQSGSTRYNAFNRISYKLNDQINLYGQSIYTNYKVNLQSSGLSDLSNTVKVSPKNPFIQSDMKKLLDSRADPNANFAPGAQYTLVSPIIDNIETTYMEFLTGLSAKDFYRDWTSDIYASYGRNRTDQKRLGSADINALNSVLQASDGGKSLCTGGFDIFHYVPLSQSCKDYLSRPLTRNTTNEQRVVEANLQGSAFNVPAGEVRFALGTTYRSVEFVDRLSIEYVLASATGVNPTLPSSGEFDTKEVYGEMLIPVLKDLPFVESFDLDLGYRYANYSSIGGATSYKASAAWKVIPSVLLRAGYQSAIRAPSAGDLFGGLNTGKFNTGLPTTGGGDPCDIRHPARKNASATVAAQIQAICVAQGVAATIYPTFQNSLTNALTQSTGNTDLNEEKAKSVTVGVTWQSHLANPLLSRMSASVDYYNIDITDAIGTITPLVSLSRCFNIDGVSNTSYDPKNFNCSLIGRLPATGIYSFIQTPLLNLSGYKTAGVDFQLDWAVHLADLGLPEGTGSISLNSVIGYTSKYAIQSTNTDRSLNYAGTIGNNQIDDALAHPKWKATTALGYQVGPATATLRWRYIAAMDNALVVTSPTAVTHGVKAVHYIDLNGTWRFGDRWEVRGGVLNLTDKFPPVLAFKGDTDPNAYDLVGRRFFMGLTAHF